MKKLLSFLSYLIKPAAIGIYVTLVVLYIANSFYLAKVETSDSAVAIRNPILEVLATAHQKSIDFRLQARGPRSGSEQVALLAIDERAVSTVGRWPWPREIIAKAIENAVHYGAKVLAFDIVFSEPTQKPAEEIFSQVQNDSSLPTPIAQKIQTELEKRDSDKIFSATIKKHSAHVVLGVFSNGSSTEAEPPFVNSCINFVLNRGNDLKQWKKEAMLVGYFDDYPIDIPQFLEAFYTEHLGQIEEEIRASSPKPKNRAEEADLNSKIRNTQFGFCEEWLNHKVDSTYATVKDAWADIKSQEGENIKETTFDEWIEKTRNSGYPSALPIYFDWVMNTPLISEGVAHSGFFNAELDQDGSIRRKSLVVRTGDVFVPSLALKAFLVANNLNANLRVDIDENLNKKVVSRLYLTDNEEGTEVMDIPTDYRGRLPINYAGKQRMFSYLSMADLLNDAEEAEVTQRLFNKDTQAWEVQTRKVKKADYIKDKIFIVGATATGIYDLRVTPFDENYPGAETHINIIDNLIRRDFLKTTTAERKIMLSSLLVMGLLLSFALSNLGAVSGLLITALSLASTAFGDQYYIFGNGYVIAIIFPIFLILTIYTVLTFYKYFTEERGKKELRTTFQKYVSPAIVEEILADPSNIELGGRKMNLTVFFSDVRGFTTISEKLDPKALSDLLNSYLTPMTDLVFKNRGTLDKYMGDAIMAFFGAPIAYADHAKWACRCALENLKKLEELRAEYAKQGLPEIDIGIGLNTGECNVGNMGSQTVRNYTVMGDAVNLASRLEGINKQYGTRIIISEFTYQDVKNDFICREVDWVKVKGKVLPVKIYELISEKTAPATTMDLIKKFNSGYELYHLKNFSQALDAFTSALNINPSDSVTKLYVERCQDYIETPPPEDWDGVFIMKSK